MKNLGHKLLRASLLVVLLSTLGGCAYFNTFYFAKKHYNQGERRRAETAAESDIVPTDAVNSYNKAILQCKKVLNFHTGSRWVDDAVFLLGASYYGKAAFDSALTTFDDFVRSFPDSDKQAEAQYYRGLCYYEQNEFEEMESAFSEALAIDQDFEYVDNMLYTRARTAERQLDYNRAIGAYRQLVSTFPGTDRGEDGLLEIGRLYFESEKYDSALVAYRELVAATKDEERYQTGQLQIGRSLIRLGGADEALDRLRRQLPREEGVGRGAGSDYPPQVRLIMAQALNRMSRHEEAIEELAVVPEKYPSSPYAVEAQYQIGFTYESYMDSLTSAETAYGTAAKMPSRSSFRDLARERLVELKKLIALSSQATAESEGNAAEEKQAEAALKIAELYYFSRREIDLAKGQYQTVIDGYPETSIAPRAAYGLAWLALREEPADTTLAYQAFRDLVAEYPASDQARSAIDFLAVAGEDTVGLGDLLIEPEPVTTPSSDESESSTPAARIPGTSVLSDSLRGVSTILNEDSGPGTLFPGEVDSLLEVPTLPDSLLDGTRPVGGDTLRGRRIPESRLKEGFKP